MVIIMKHDSFEKRDLASITDEFNKKGKDNLHNYRTTSSSRFYFQFFQGI